jgi:hypothetical protein
VGFAFPITAITRSRAITRFFLISAISVDQWWFSPFRSRRSPDHGDHPIYSVLLLLWLHADR